MTSAVATTSRWPDAVWDAPILRGLDARARSELQAAGRLIELRAGERVFRAGDPADALYVVASGVCTLIGLRRGEAEPTSLRRARKSEVFGEEAIVAAFATRQLEARCESDAIVAEVPLVVLKRAAGRAGGAELMAKVERSLRRAATLDLFRTTSFTRGLPEHDLEVLLDAAKHVDVARGEHVYREGDAATDAFFVADGLVQVQTRDGGKPRIEAYLGRGDLFGDEELARRDSRSVSVVASGPTRLVAIPRDVFVGVARRNGPALEASRRLQSEVLAFSPPLARGTQATAHVFQDLYRVRIARSLLVIDQDSCIRCGHCAWSCADAHDDGVSRLVRRGDKIVVGGEGREIAGEGSAVSPLLVPNSCQHCMNPSCMIDCPTGAIGRNARGEVFIREDLCTGCGSCAKGCPWENIQMAPRREGGPYPSVAVKCDLCSGSAGGPACVAACPTQAIARIDPNAGLVDLRLPDRGTRTRRATRARRPPVLPPRTPAWPWAIGAALAGTGMSALPAGRWTSGVIAGTVMSLLMAHALAKRVRRPVAWLAARAPLARWLHILHLALGAFGAGVVLAHAGARATPNVAGALSITVATVIVTGAIGAAIVALAPRALSRIERRSVLPEELAERPRELDEKIFATLSGKTELVKTLFVKALGPYWRSRFGPLALVVSRRTLRAEEKVVRARVDVLTGGKKGPALGAIDELVRLVVEHRAVRAQRWLTWALRGWLVPHIAVAVGALILLVLHVVAVTHTKGSQRHDAPTASVQATERAR